MMKGEQVTQISLISYETDSKKSKHLRNSKPGDEQICKMNTLIRNISSQLIRNQKLMVIQCSRFATDPKIIEEMTKKNKVVVFMKVRSDKSNFTIYVLTN